MLDAIHPNALVACAAILFGLTLGMALALSEWTSKFAIGGIITTFIGSVTSFTADKINAVKEFLESASLLSPILWCLNIALGTFILTLLSAASIVFSVNLVTQKRRGDPEAFAKAARRATAVFGTGLYRYATIPPDQGVTNRIRDLEKHIDTLGLLHSTLVSEVYLTTRSEQHFLDSIEAIGRLLLQHSFGEHPDLQDYRMAFFQRQGSRLEYMIAVNNRDWTAHTMEGFDLDRSFMGVAIKKNRPLVYPKDKKLRTPFEKRKQSRYKSFLAIPVPCGQADEPNIGALTLDYTGHDSVFTETRIAEASAFSHLISALYILNIRRANNESREDIRPHN